MGTFVLIAIIFWYVIKIKCEIEEIKKMLKNELWQQQK